MQRLWSQQEGQDVAEYAVILAVVILLVVGTVRIIGSSATNIFSAVGSSIAQ
jgi:Flp pilus assembly pilin Flp